MTAVLVLLVAAVLAGLAAYAAARWFGRKGNL